MNNIIKPVTVTDATAAMIKCEWENRHHVLGDVCWVHKDLVDGGPASVGDDGYLEFRPTKDSAVWWFVHPPF